MYQKAGGSAVGRNPNSNFSSNFLLNILGVLSWSEYPWKLKSCLIPQLHDGKYGNVGALADSAADTAEQEICCDIHRAKREYREDHSLNLQGWTPNTANTATTAF